MCLSVSVGEPPLSHLGQTCFQHVVACQVLLVLWKIIDRKLCDLPSCPLFPRRCCCLLWSPAGGEEEGREKERERTGISVVKGQWTRVEMPFRIVMLSRSSCCFSSHWSLWGFLEIRAGCLQWRQIGPIMGLPMQMRERARAREWEMRFLGKIITKPREWVHSSWHCPLLDFRSLSCCRFWISKSSCLQCHLFLILSSTYQSCIYQATPLSILSSFHHPIHDSSSIFTFYIYSYIYCISTF